MGLTRFDWTVMAVCFVFVLGIGVMLKREMKTKIDNFQAGRPIPAWVCDVGFMSTDGWKQATRQALRRGNCLGGRRVRRWYWRA